VNYGLRCAKSARCAECRPRSSPPKPCARSSWLTSLPDVQLFPMGEKMPNYSRHSALGSRAKVQTIDGSRPEPPNVPPAAHRLIPRADRHSIARKFFDRSAPGTTTKLARLNRLSLRDIEWTIRDYFHEQVAAAREAGLSEGLRQKLVPIEIRRVA
jgi:hypothetical protein